MVVLIEMDKSDVDEVVEARRVLLVHHPCLGWLVCWVFGVCVQVRSVPVSTGCMGARSLVGRWGWWAGVMVLFSPVLAVRSAAREQIYRVLLVAPDRSWQIAELSAHLPGVSVEAVRTTLYLMLGDQLVEPMPGHRSLTLRLSGRGRTAVEQIVASWTVAVRREAS